ncbi:collagen-like protein [Streptomyces sp. NPDC058442]|uniref:collagen-like triple helix repeat-containing protein n=1 Tax=Streptomyces sp. NPDC058442 TaxID=3346503 RepID=UPI0036461424
MSTAPSPESEGTRPEPGTAVPAQAGPPDNPGSTAAPPSQDARGVPEAPGSPGTPHDPDRPGARPGPPASAWRRRLLVGLALGLLAWGVAALLAPDAGTGRQLAAAALCAGAVVAVQYVLGPDREAREERAERILTVAAADVENTVREDLARHGDDLRTALARHTEDMRQLVESRFAQLDRAPEPYPPLDRVRMDGVPELARRFADVLAPGSPLLYSFIRLEMQRVIGHMSALTRLSVESHGENHDWMLTLTHVAERSICAISTSVDREFWNSEPAGRYLDAQKQAIEEHGVPVRRLFLLESARELDDRLLRLCDEQQALHIEVRVAVLPELPPHIQRGTANDFIVYDEEVSFEIEQDLRDVNVRTRLIARQDHVQEQMKRFWKLWEVGMGIRELEVRVDDEEEGTWMVDHT